MQYASPTFLFREDCPSHLEEIMEQLAAIHFDGIELYGNFGYTGKQIRSFSEKTGLEIICDHIPYKEFTEHTEAIISSRKEAGVRYLTVDRIPDDHLPGHALFYETISELHRIGESCKKQDVQLLYHNHGYDLTHKVDDVPVLEMLLDAVEPELLKFQPDLGWLSLGGGDPAYYLKKYVNRCPIIHLKDYYSSDPVILESPFFLGTKRGGEAFYHFEFRPSGYGVMNYPALMPLILSCRPAWMTVDHDMSYERSNYDDMTMSLNYIKQLVNLSTPSNSSEA